MPQTTVQQSDTIRFGSGTMEIGSDVDNLVNVGAFRAGSFEESFDKVSIKSDNAGEIYAGINNHVASLGCELMEINLDRLGDFFSGVGTTSQVAAASVPVSDEVHALNGTQAVRLDHRMGAGSEAESIVVTDYSGNAAVRNTDYVISVDSDGYTCIARVAASTVIADGEQVKVDYSYTPNASRKYVAGGLYQLNAKVVRFTNTNAAGKKFQITVFKATAAEGITIEFQPDDADDVNITPIKMEGTPDATRTAGQQLFEIVDEQHTT